jgi:hypothetical protein
MDEEVIAAMAQLCERDGISDHQLRKRLGLGMSQLNRVLSLLASAPEAGGLGCVELRSDTDARRRTIWLTERGRSLCSRT